MSIPLPAGDDAQYLAETVGETLAAALARVAVVQPNDPVDWLGRHILASVAAERRREQREREARTVEAETAEFERNEVAQALEDAKRARGRSVRQAGRYARAVEDRRRAVVARWKREWATEAARVRREKAKSGGGAEDGGADDDDDEDDEDEEAAARREKARARELAELVAVAPEPDAGEVSRAMLVSIAADLARCTEATPAADPARVPGDAVTREVRGPASAAAGSAAPDAATPRSAAQAVPAGGALAAPWVSAIESAAHDMDGVIRASAEGGSEAAEEAAKVDESHALFRVLRALLLLLGYPAAEVTAWPRVRALVSEGYFVKQLELHDPAAREEETMSARLSACAEALSGIDLGELHASPIVGTVLLEYAREASRLAEAISEGRVRVQIQNSEGPESVGKGIVQANVEVTPPPALDEAAATAAVAAAAASADTAAVAAAQKNLVEQQQRELRRKRRAAGGLRLEPLPGLNACLIEAATAAKAPLQFRVSWTYTSEPAPPVIPGDDDGDGAGGDGAGRGGDRDSDSDSDASGNTEASASSRRSRGGRRSGRKKGGRSSSRGRKGSSKKSKKGKRPSSAKKRSSRRGRDSSDESSDDDGNDSDSDASGARGRRGPRWEPEVDVSCLVLDASGSVVDAVYFDKVYSGDGAVSVSEFAKTLRASGKKAAFGRGRKGKSKGGAADDQDPATPANTEVFTVDLPRLPATAHSLAFSLGCNIPGETLAHVGVVDVEVTGKGDSAQDPPLAYFSFPAAYANDHVLAALLHRAEEDPSAWCLRAIADPVAPRPDRDGRHAARVHATALPYLDSFGVGTYAGEPAAGIGAQTRFTLAPGEGLDLNPEEITIGLGWTPAAPRTEDGPAVEAEGAFVLFEGEEITDTVSADNDSAQDGAIAHAGDENRDLSKTPDGDNETVRVSLASVDRALTSIVVAVSVPDDEQSVRDLAEVYVRLADAETRKEVCRFTVRPRDLGEGAVNADTGTLILGKIVRASKRSWEFVAGGVASEGRSAGDAEEIEHVSAASWSIPRVLRPGRPEPVTVDGAMVSLSWTASARVNAVDISAAAFSEGSAADTVSMDRAKSNDKAIVHQGDDREGLLPGETSRVSVNFNKMSERIDTVVFIASARASASSSSDGDGSKNSGGGGGGGGGDDAAADAASDLSAVDSVTFALFDEESQRKVAVFTAHPSQLERSASVALVKLTRAANGSWEMCAVGEPLGASVRGPDDGGAVAAQRGILGADWNPPLPLSAGDAYVTRKRKVTFGFDWAAPATERIDVDASAWIYAGEECVETVTYQTQMSSDGAVVHAGDNRGERPVPGAGGRADREKVRVALQDIREDVDTIVLFLHVYDDAHSFLDIERSSVRVLDEDNNVELATFAVPADTKKTQACVMCKVQWRGDAWVVVPIGETQKKPDPADVRVTSYLRRDWTPKA